MQASCGYNRGMALIFIYLSTVFTFLVSTHFAIGSWAYRRSYLHRLVFIIEASYAVWAFSLLSVLAVEDMQFKILISHSRHLILPLMFPSWALLTAALFVPALSRWLRRHWLLVFAFPAAVIGVNVLVMAGVPAVEGWMLHDFYPLPDIGGLLGVSRGPVLRASFIYSAFCTVAAFGIALYAVLALRGSRRQYALVMMAIGIWPVVMEVVGLILPPEIPWRQLKVIGLWPFIWAVHYAASRVDMLEITSLAQQKVFERLPGPVVILNTRGEYWGGNQAAQSILGLGDHLKGRAADEVPILSGLLTTGDKYQTGGTTYQVLRHSLEFYEGESQAQIFLLNDVTEIEESNKALRDLNGEILRMHRSSKRVQTVLAHDLAGALSGTQMMLKGVVGQMEQQGGGAVLHQLGHISEAHQASLDLLKNILTWSREDKPEGGVDLQGRVQAAIHHLSPQILLKNVQVDVQLPKEEILLWGSAGVVEAVVRNLLSNAVKFSPPGARVQVIGTPAGRFIELSILDEGPGIPEEVVARLAEATGTVTSGEGGFGLGLRFTMDFVTQMGGVLSFDQDASQGARVRVRFPVLGQS